jgi:DNA-binding transcriptional LysR family regulator
MLDLHRLRLLKEFAARGSIAGTAASLGYTSSAVSQQLAALEREAGAALLDRTARRAELTDAGRRLAVRAERILAMVEEAEADLSARAQEPSGRVVVSAFPSAAVAFAPVLARSLRAHPDLTLLLRQAAGEVGLRQVRSGEVDVAIVDDWSGRHAATSDGILSLYHLVSDPLVLVVPRSHPSARGAGPVGLKELRDEAWMAAPEGEPSRHAVDRLLAAVGGHRPFRGSSRASGRSSASSRAESASRSSRGSSSRRGSGGWPSAAWPAPIRAARSTRSPAPPASAAPRSPPSSAPSRKQPSPSSSGGSPGD